VFVDNGLISFEERHAKITVLLSSFVKLARAEILPPSADGERRAMGKEGVVESS
jgi:hypothetical protein